MALRAKLEQMAEAILDFAWGALHTTEGQFLVAGLSWVTARALIPVIPASILLPPEVMAPLSGFFGTPMPSEITPGGILALVPIVIFGKIATPGRKPFVPTSAPKPEPAPPAPTEVSS